MGKRGPAPTPTALLAARGSWRADLRKNEPVFVGEVDQPQWLSDMAKLHWDVIKPMLANAGVLMASDAPALGVLVETCARYLHYKKVFAEEYQNAPAFYDGKGNLVGNPVADKLEKVQIAFERLLSKFGMDPSSRASIEKIPVNITNSQVVVGTDKSRFFK